MRWSLLLPVLLVLVAACGKEDPKVAPVVASPAASKVSVSATSLELRAEHPPTTGCLEAVVSAALPAEGLRWLVNGQVVAGQNGTVLCREFFRRGDEVAVQLNAEGGALARALKVANAPPRVSDVTFTASVSRINVNPTAVDVDGDGVTFRYEWVVNGEVDPFLTEASAPRSRFQLADKVQVRIVPNDGTEDGPVYASKQFAQPNSPPRIVSVPPDRYDAYEYLYQVKASDIDNDKLVFSLESPPQGMTIGKNSGKISWPLKEVFPGQYRIRIVVRDPEGGEARQEFTLNLAEPSDQ